MTKRNVCRRVFFCVLFCLVWFLFGDESLISGGAIGCKWQMGRQEIIIINGKKSGRRGNDGWLIDEREAFPLAVCYCGWRTIDGAVDGK